MIPYEVAQAALSICGIVIGAFGFVVVIAVASMRDVT